MKALEIYKQMRNSIFQKYNDSVVQVENLNKPEPIKEMYYSFLTVNTISELISLVSAQYTFLKMQGLLLDYEEFINELHLEICLWEKENDKQ